MRSILVILICFLFSCKQEKDIDFYTKFVSYVDCNFDKYADVYDNADIWLKDARKARQDNVKSIIFDPNYKLDKLLIINQEGNKLVGTVNLSDSVYKTSNSDWIFMISGVKLNGEWKFIRGGSLYVPRQNYKYNIYEPLNHAELSYIGRDFFLKRFLIFNGEKVTVNSEKINNHVTLEGQFRMANGAFVTNWEEYIEDQNSKIISDKEYNDIIEDLKNQVHEDKVLPKKGTKEWKELYGTKIPLFEREEWKNLRIK